MTCATTRCQALERSQATDSGSRTLSDHRLRTHRVESDVVFDGEVVHAVGSDSTIICVVHTAVANVRLINGPDQVEMDRVSTKLVCLACVPYFDVLNTEIRQM